MRDLRAAAAGWTQAAGNGLPKRLGGGAGGGVAKRQTGDVKNRRAIRFSFCPSDEYRGDS